MVNTQDSHACSEGLLPGARDKNISHLADCKQRVIQHVPFVTHMRTKEIKLVAVGQVRGYLISSFVFCDTEVTLPYWFLGYHGLVPIYQKGFREQLFSHT